MKKVIVCILVANAIFCDKTAMVNAQVPNAIPYQAVARNAAGNLITNQNISLRFSIHDVTAAGTVVYKETQSATTNSLGLFSVNIGQGTVVTGPFSGINWGSGAKFTQVEMDATGGSAYTDMGTTQLMSVPYALYAGGSATSSGDDWNTTGNNISNNNTGNVGIGTSTPAASAKLEVASTTGGFLLPRMNTAQRNAIASPAAALMIYNTDNNCIETFNTTGWISMCQSGISYTATVSAPDTWLQKTDLGGVGRHEAVGFAISTKGYIGTGFGAGAALKKDFWEYNPSTNAWTQKADFGGTARRSAVGFGIGSKGYIGTGSDATGIRKDFWEYDPAANAWTQKTDFGGTARSGAVGFATSTKGYIGTGNDGAYTKDFWEYNPVSNLWTQKQDFGGTARTFATGFVVNNNGYLGTGNDGGSSVDFWKYNPITNVWTQQSNFGGTARALAVGFSIGLKGYIATGNDGTLKSDLWVFDPATNIWTQMSSINTARMNAIAFGIGTKGYIGTGIDAASAERKDFWEYTQ